MLTVSEKSTARLAAPDVQDEFGAVKEAPNSQVSTSVAHSRFARVFHLEWLGQTVASLCWIASVFAYGITSAGDWLQLAAASAWFLANLAAVMTTEAD